MSEITRSASRTQGSAEDAAFLRPLWWAYVPVVLLALLGASITIFLFAQSVDRVKSEVEIKFREASHDRVLVVHREIAAALAITQDIASLFAASKAVSRRDFRRFVGPSLQRFPGIRALVWAPVVSAAERAGFVTRARGSYPPFQIREFKPGGKGVESGDRRYHYPVLYVQPFASNKATLGADLASDPMISKLLQQAEFAQTPQVSSAISLDGADAAEKSFVVAIAVSSEDESAEDGHGPPAARGGPIRGFALGAFGIRDIVEQGLSNTRPGGIDLHFYRDDTDGVAPLLYTHLSRLRVSSGRSTSEEDTDLTFSEHITVGGEQWRVVCNPAPGRFEINLFTSWIILAGGMAFTALLTVYLATIVGRTRRVRLEVEDRTAQLREAVAALNREVGERKSAEQQLQNLNERLEQHIASRTAEAERRAQYLEQFAYVASHDLKAPLRAVSNLAQWIEEDLDKKLNDSSREQLSLLRDRVRRMHDLIEGLLEYSRVGRTGAQEEMVDTRELIEETIDSLLPPKGFKIRIRGDMPTLRADRLQLGQVFANLLSNSLKHHGGEKGKIRVAVENLGELHEFSVCDDGAGIAPEYHDKVFLMFQTLGSSDMGGSTGIGLALVKKIVEEHGGRIRLESAVGEGTCVFFTWPKGPTQ
ncbi:MAG: CHASE domain-containing protein [Sedimenticolaceae bacterium]